MHNLRHLRLVWLLMRFQQFEDLQVGISLGGLSTLVKVAIPLIIHGSRGLGHHQRIQNSNQSLFVCLYALNYVLLCVILTIAAFILGDIVILNIWHGWQSSNL